MPTKKHDLDFPVSVGAKGRVVLPAKLRKKLKLQVGDQIVFSLHEDGSITVDLASKKAQEMEGFLADIAPGRSWVDELIEERSREALKEL